MANLPLPLFIGLRYTGSRRRNQLVSFISLISMVGLVMGVALLLIVLSVMNGFDRELRERILGVMPQATVFHRNGIVDWPTYAEQFERHPLVLASAPFVQLHGLLSQGVRVAPVIVYGVDAARELQVSRIGEFVRGKALNELAANELLIGAGVARQLQVQAGDALTLVVPDKEDAGQMPRVGGFVVAGIVDTGTEVDNGLALSRLDTAASLLGQPGMVSGIRLKITDLFRSRQVVSELMDSLDYGFYGSEWTRSHGNLFQAVQMSRKLVGLLLFLIIAIAAFNVVSTLVMVVVDKQSQIAILRSQGAGTGTIMQIFMVQGTLIGLAGTLLGLLLGSLGSLWVSDFVSWLERLLDIRFLASDVYPVSYLPSDFRWQDCRSVGVTAMLMSLLATIYPAWKASRVAPADALRFDH